MGTQHGDTRLLPAAGGTRAKLSGMLSGVPNAFTDLLNTFKVSPDRFFWNKCRLVPIYRSFWGFFLFF